MKEVTIESSEDLLHLEVIDLLGLLATMTIDKDCDSITMLVKRIGSNYGDFEYDFTCNRIVENEELSIMDKIKRWFE